MLDVSFFFEFNQILDKEKVKFLFFVSSLLLFFLTTFAEGGSASENQSMSRTMSGSSSSVGNNALDPDKWIQAPVFIPKSSSGHAPPSFASIVEQNFMNNFGTTQNSNSADSKKAERKEELCPYLLNGICYYESCLYTHGEFCELCQRFCLHPTDVDQRRKHEVECVAQHERDMELSFAIAKSKDKTCGVCFEVIMEKPGREQRFGILPSCQHCFCLECIRKWRQAELFDNSIKRACPECRTTSDFVCPSAFWVDTKEEKEKLITDYKNAMETKDCKYYNKVSHQPLLFLKFSYYLNRLCMHSMKFFFFEYSQGRGKCPFGNKCFYRHALPDGTLVDVGFPTRPARRLNQFGELEELEDILFWDLLRVGRIHIPEDVASMISSSDLDDWLFE